MADAEADTVNVRIKREASLESIIQTMGGEEGRVNPTVFKYRQLYGSIVLRPISAPAIAAFTIQGAKCVLEQSHASVDRRARCTRVLGDPRGCTPVTMAKHCHLSALAMNLD